MCWANGWRPGPKLSPAKRPPAECGCSTRSISHGNSCWDFSRHSAGANGSSSRSILPNLAGIRLKRMALPGPEPAESAGGQQAVDKSIGRFLEDPAPRLALPDAVDQRPPAVNQQPSGAGDAEPR